MIKFSAFIILLSASLLISSLSKVLIILSNSLILLLFSSLLFPFWLNEGLDISFGELFLQSFSDFLSDSFCSSLIISNSEDNLEGLLSITI